MMKYLLFHAKIKFTSNGDNVGMGQCDRYQGLVDLLGLLVVDNFKDLPSLEELMKMDSVRLECFHVIKGGKSLYRYRVSWHEISAVTSDKL